MEVIIHKLLPYSVNITQYLEKCLGCDKIVELNFGGDLQCCNSYCFDCFINQKIHCWNCDKLGCISCMKNKHLITCDACEETGCIKCEKYNKDIEGNVYCEDCSDDGDRIFCNNCKYVFYSDECKRCDICEQNICPECIEVDTCHNCGFSKCEDCSDEECYCV